MVSNWRDVYLGAAATATTLFVFYELKQVFFDPRYAASKPPAPKVNGLPDLIGNTPIVRINSLSKLTGCDIYAKLELTNIGGSSKDRVAYELIRAAEASGKLLPGRGDVIFEGTSGSTGISLTTVGRALGYRVHIVLQDDTSPEKITLLESLGATVEKVKPALIVDPDQFVNLAEKRAIELTSDPSTPAMGLFANQFENDNNWKVHYNHTAPEIFSQMNGKLDAFVAGAGTGGTISGIAKYLRERIPQLGVYLADPQGSGFYNRVNFGVLYDKVEKEGTRRRHQVDTVVEGIGLNRLTHNFLVGEELIDGAVRVSDKQALMMAKFLTVNDGYFWGSASAIAAVGCVKVAQQLGPGKKLLMIATDSGARHLSKFWKMAAKEDSEITLEEILNEK